MIEHVDLQNPGSFSQPTGQPDISITRRRIPGRMVVLCEARIYVQSAMVERRGLLGRAATQGARSVRLRSHPILPLVETLVCSPAAHVLALHITKVQTTMTGCRSCA